MWTLATNKPISIRRIDKPLRSFIEIASGGERWKGDRAHVQITDYVSISVEPLNRKPTLYDFITGYSRTLETVEVRERSKLEPAFRASYHQTSLDPGDAVIERRRNGSWYSSLPDTVSIYVSLLWDTDERRHVLEVARDAALQANAITPHVYALAREALPRAHGLFVALVRKEINSDG